MFACGGCGHCGVSVSHHNPLFLRLLCLVGQVLVVFVGCSLGVFSVFMLVGFCCCSCLFLACFILAFAGCCSFARSMLDVSSFVIPFVLHLYIYISSAFQKKKKLNSYLAFGILGRIYANLGIRKTFEMKI